jgi:hypothetical protein
MQPEIFFSRHFSFSLNTELSTPALTRFEYYVNDSGVRVPVLSSSFLTPFILAASAGICIRSSGLGSLHFGISGFKLTYLRDSSIIRKRKVKEYYGIPAGKNRNIEYGLSMHLLVDKYLLSRCHWDCDVHLFKNYNSPVALTIRNAIEVNINRFLKTSLQTRIFYEEKQCKNLQVENILTIGFYCHL